DYDDQSDDDYEDVSAETHIQLKITKFQHEIKKMKTFLQEQKHTIALMKILNSFRA
ncbi:hypothetical protein EMPG_12460, partial [Blastomyces silverae]